jgi:imidazolonepropionase
MLTLIHNIAKLYTPDETGGFGHVTEIENPQILVRDNFIETIAADHRTPDPVSCDQIIDARGCCVLPGFVDAHTHPVFGKTREREFSMRIAGKTYEEIAAAGGGIRNSARVFQRMGVDELKPMTAERLAVFLEYGTTTIEAKSGYGLTVADELKSLQILADLSREQSLEMVPTFLGAHEIPDEFRHRRQEYIQLVINEMIPEVSRRRLAEYCDVFCERGVFTVSESRSILEAAQKYGLRARIHANELHESGGATLAAELRAVSADHLVHVSRQEITAMKEAGVIAILLPLTTFFLRKNEYAPAREFIGQGCPVALATDFNPGSSMCQNMQLVWSVGALKLGLFPGELLWATTIIPARSLQRDRKIGSIAPGKQADLIFLRIPNLDYLPYHLGINHVHLTMKKGRVVYSRYN